MGEQPYSAAGTAASRPLRYTRPLLATAILLVAVPLFCRAGLWQLDRAAEKQALLDRFASALAAPISTALRADMTTADYKFQRFTLAGRYLPERQILLDNMTQDGANGYQVLTPFRTANQTVLINRGWLPASAQREVLPAIGVAGDPRTVTARLANLPEPGIRLATTATAAQDWPRRLLFPDQAQLEAVLGMDLPDWQLLLEPDQPDGFKRDWRAIPGNSGPAKHQGYALQWFSFAALTVVFYIILIRGWWRERRVPARPG